MCSHPSYSCWPVGTRSRLDRASHHTIILISSFQGAKPKIMKLGSLCSEIKFPKTKTRNPVFCNFVQSFQAESDDEIFHRISFMWSNYIFCYPIFMNKTRQLDQSIGQPRKDKLIFQNDCISLLEYKCIFI